MLYYIDDNRIELEELKKRIETTDLIPSYTLLLDGIEEKFDAIKNYGILTLADLRKELKNPKTMAILGTKTNIDIKYLTILRREIEGYFPKPIPISAFDWLENNKLNVLENRGYKNTVMLYESLTDSDIRYELINTADLDEKFLDEILGLAEITRIQWVSAKVARLLSAAGYVSVKSIAEADAETFYKDVENTNKENKYYNGKIGFRDIKRLIKGAEYLS